MRGVLISSYLARSLECVCVTIAIRKSKRLRPSRRAGVFAILKRSRPFLFKLTTNVGGFSSFSGQKPNVRIANYGTRRVRLAQRVRT